MGESGDPTPEGVVEFVERWLPAEAAERASYQTFLAELTQLLRLPPILTQGMEGAEAYCFEKAVKFFTADGSYTTRRIDLYKRDCFVLEAKQGAHAKPEESLQVEPFGDTLSAKARRKRNAAARGTNAWERAMNAAFGQANTYAHHLPEKEGWPPFLIVADIGYCFDLYANFSRNGRTYLPFPAPRRNRLLVKNLADSEVRDTLRLIWTNPDALDPAQRTEKVTREISAKLAVLARSLERSGHSAERVSQFLMRCLFTMFAEDSGLLPKNAFTDLLDRYRDAADKLPPMLAALWRDMDKGTIFSPVIEAQVRRFNGRLFHDQTPLLLTGDQIDLLHDASKADWREVEPAIFGTLLERALDAKERHKLGAHYTPRAYVERMVVPTVIDPLRSDWEITLAAAEALANQGKEDEAQKIITEFHSQLCHVRVLDPACGSGNFLYVALELIKRLEGEVLAALEAYGGQGGFKTDQLEVSPQQFLGLEINPRAATIAEIVLWIGYLQWHLRTFGESNPPDPVLKEYDNVLHQDALLVFDDKQLRLGPDGRPSTKWDGESFKADPATGRQVPDESKQVEDYIYTRPRQAPWPPADYIVGNPPFQGGKDLRRQRGDGYTEALWKAYPELPNSIDFVMYWWHRAAKEVCDGRARRFGFITTNSIAQTFNRRVMDQHMGARKPLSILFAIPDHPWVDAADGADVRIAMTVGTAGDLQGRLVRVTHEGRQAREGTGTSVILEGHEGKIWSNLRLGANLGSAKVLRANERVSSPGVKLHGSGFIVTPERAKELGLGARADVEKIIRPYLNGRDLTGHSRGVMVIDLHDLSIDQVRLLYPEVYQHVLESVKPERDQNRESYRRENWWLFGRRNELLRNFLEGLPRFISTVETAKHRVFVFLDAAIRPDNKLVNIGLDDAYFLGVLSSRFHVAWALAKGGRLGVGNDPVYVKTQCFDEFPFPDPVESLKAPIRELAEQLDAFRKERQTEHPDLTLTQMYNVVVALREMRELSENERQIKDRGLVQIIKEIHDELDVAVAEAFGWSVDLSDEAILDNLVSLNIERAAEEAGGEVRWLRPEFQHPSGAEIEARKETGTLGLEIALVAEQHKWPKPVKERVSAIRAVLDESGQPLTVEQVAANFKRARRTDVQDLLETLTDMGQVRHVGQNQFK